MLKIKVKNTEVTIITVENNDYISLTDIAKFKTDDTSAVIANWIRNRNTILKLNQIAIQQMKILQNANQRNILK